MQLETLKNIILEIKQQLLNAVLMDVREIDEKTLNLIFYKKSTPHHLLISLKPTVARIHLTEKERGKTPTSPFTKRLFQLLKNSVLINLELINQDKILSLYFLQGNQKLELILELFFKNPQGYITDNTKKIMATTNWKNTLTYVLPEKKSAKKIEEEIFYTSAQLEHFYIEKEKALQFNELYSFLEKSFQKKENLLLKKIEKNTTQLQNCNEWHKYQHLADLLQSNFHKISKGAREIRVFDWNIEKDRIIPLNPRKKMQEEIADHYKKAKKLKKGIPFAEELLKKTEKELSSLQSEMHKLKQIVSYKELKQFAELYIKPAKSTHPKVQNKELNLPYKEYTSSSGFKIWVGKSAEKNEILTFRYAHGSDIWLHARDVPGSHVIIKSIKGKQIDENTLLEACKLAIKHSKAKNSNEGEVIFTEQKNVVKVKGSKKGAVTLSNYKTRYIEY